MKKTILNVPVKIADRMSFKTTHAHTQTHTHKKMKQMFETEVFQLLFKEQINFLEGVAFKLCFENRKSAGKTTKFLLQEECGADISNIIDLLHSIFA